MPIVPPVPTVRGADIAAAAEPVACAAADLQKVILPAEVQPGKEKSRNTLLPITTLLQKQNPINLKKLLLMR